jgi:hypothetical protein
MCGAWQPLNAVKVGVLNGHHTCVYAAVISDVDRRL